MKLKDLFKEGELKELLPALMIQTIEASGEVKIDALTDDSRKVKPGFLFVAIKGLEHDGHNFIEQAVESGAVAVVFDTNSNYQLPVTKSEKTVFIEVKNSQKALGLLWASWYGFPSKKLKVIGVTGTDGKTTTTNLIYQILNLAGKRVGMVSTINARIGQREIDTGFHVTNPEPELLQKLLKEMVEDEIEYAVLEVTSHGIDQERVSGVDFTAAVFTNITHEHLDYHKTFQDYLITKGKIFEKVKLSVLNQDDVSYTYLHSISSGKVLTYGFSELSDFYTVEVSLSDNSSSFRIMHKRQSLESGIINLKLLGNYNVANALAAATLCLEFGLTFEQVKYGLESFTHLEGRFDEIKLGQPFRVIVDFAHTPNALEQVLKLSSKFKVQNGELVVVFGCAGERDREKRAMMGKIAGRLADFSVVTAEDPRRENVDDIIGEIVEGFRKTRATEVQGAESLGKKCASGGHSYIRVPDRKKAIELALRTAQPNDIILITGKGHEKSMCFGTTEHPWDDKKVAINVLKKLGF